MQSFGNATPALLPVKIQTENQRRDAWETGGQFGVFRIVGFDFYGSDSPFYGIHIGRVVQGLERSQALCQRG